MCIIAKWQLASMAFSITITCYHPLRPLRSRVLCNLWGWGLGLDGNLVLSLMLSA